jgi:hypothetical protein
MSENTTQQDEIVIACDLTAISAEEREAHFAVSRGLFAAVTEVREHADRYAFRLPTDSASLIHAAQFIANERLCCPFLTFTLRVEPQRAGLWLELSGNDDVKLFIRTEISSLLSEPVARAAGLQ